jgi:hypothetical protein
VAVDTINLFGCPFGYLFDNSIIPGRRLMRCVGWRTRGHARRASCPR